MIGTLTSTTSTSAALALVRPTATAVLGSTGSQDGSRQDWVTLSLEAQRLSGLTKGQTASLDARGAGSSEAAYGRAVQQRVKAILDAAASTDKDKVKNGNNGKSEAAQAANNAKANETAAATTPVLTAPITTAPITTAPITTAPITTAPVTTAPVTTAPVTKYTEKYAEKTLKSDQKAKLPQSTTPGVILNTVA